MAAMTATMGVQAPYCRPQKIVATQRLSSGSRISSAACFQTSIRAPRLSQRLSSLQVHNALSKGDKVVTVEKLVNAFESSTVVFGVRFKNLSVKQQQQFRSGFPESTKIIVCKNTLLRIAADKVEGWSDLKQATNGENAWVFVQEDAIKESVKAFLTFEEALVKALPKDKKDTKPTDISGGVLDGDFLTYEDVKKLEKLPTKKELYATIARLIKQVPTKVAVSIKQVPTKLAYGVKALADADEDTSKLVGDVLPKPATESE